MENVNNNIIAVSELQVETFNVTVTSLEEERDNIGVLKEVLFNSKENEDDYNSGQIIELIYSNVPDFNNEPSSLMKYLGRWIDENRNIMLRQHFEDISSKYEDYLDSEDFLTHLTEIKKVVSKLDDKLFLMDIGLMESIVHFVRDLPKARDILKNVMVVTKKCLCHYFNGLMYIFTLVCFILKKKSYENAYEYFDEAFKAFNALEDPRAIFSLKYMLLSKIMVNQAEDVAGIISSKAGLQYDCVELDAMKVVVDAHSRKSMKFLKVALRDYKAQLVGD